MPGPSDTILLTGFEAFGGESINPSGMIASALHDSILEGHRIEAVVLPVTFAGALQELLSAVERVQPKLVVCLGQAGGEFAVCLERVAINLSDARSPDNDGVQPVGESIDDEGPVAYWSSLPLQSVLWAIANENIPVKLSNSAGTFVCNYVFYGLMQALEATPEIRGGFVHVPLLPEQVEGAGSLPCMTLEMMTKAIQIAIVASL